MNSPQKSSVPPSRTYSSPTVAIVPADGFLSDTTLSAWIRAGAARRDGHVLKMAAGEDLILTDGLRVLGRSDGESDPYGFTGKVMSLRSLIDRGAMIRSNGMRLGSATYDVELGVIAEPVRVAA
jgi:hypothetical protein